MTPVEINTIERLPFQEHTPSVNLIIHGPHSDDRGQYYTGAASTMESYSGSDGPIGDFLGKFYISREVVVESYNDLAEHDMNLIINAIENIIYKE